MRAASEVIPKIQRRQTFGTQNNDEFSTIEQEQTCRETTNEKETTTS